MKMSVELQIFCKQWSILKCVWIAVSWDKQQEASHIDNEGLSVGLTSTNLIVWPSYHNLQIIKPI